MSNFAWQLGESASVLKGGVFALGNFDGVHLGHQAVVKAAVERALGMAVPSRVLTLEPHPRSVFKPDTPPFRLTPAPVKTRLLRRLKVDDIIVVPFTQEFSRLPAEDFVQKILIDIYQAQHIVAGFDFVFGHDRVGNMKNLRHWLTPQKIGVTEVASFRDSKGEIMSSSRTRDALREGDLRTAEHILGRPWAIAGVIERGAKRGSEIGFPTANITLGDYLRPKFGVYAVLARLVGGHITWQGVANIGNRPTVDGKTEMLEVHLFNFHEDIYGQEWEVELIDFMRSEQAFPSLEALKHQIVQDVATAKARLAVMMK